MSVPDRNESGVIHVGWNQWLIIIAVLMFALKLGYDEIRKKYFGYSGPQVRRERDLSSSSEWSALDGRNGSIWEKDGVRETYDGTLDDIPDRDGGGPIHITNIEIHDSVINRSTFLSPDDEEGGEEGDTDPRRDDIEPGDREDEIYTTEIQGSVVHRSSIRPGRTDELDKTE